MVALAQIKQDISSGKNSVTSILKGIYPQVKTATESPGCWGHTHNPHFDQGLLVFPSGEYQSRNHSHVHKTEVIAVESRTDNYLNLPYKPLLLLKVTRKNYDYRSTLCNYFLFGQNENDSFFIHQVRPKWGNSFDDARKWMWALKEKEKIAARQGDLGFVAVSPPRVYEVGEKEVFIGNHKMKCQACGSTKSKRLVLNPLAIQGDVHRVSLTGWYDARLAKVWGGEKGD